MSLIVADPTLCKKDGICVESCPIRCLKQDEQGYPVAVHPENCFACGHCVAVCPHGALTNEKCGQGFTPAAPFPDAGAVAGLMLARRSVREFKTKPAPRETLAKLLDIARYAPTAVNAQLVHWTVVEDPKATSALAAMCADFLRKTGYAPQLVEAFDQGLETMLRGAPHVIVAHTPKSWDWGVEDSVIALTYAELAAPSLGLGVCWAGILTRAAQHDPAVKQALGLPEDEKAHGALMVGLPKYRYPQVPPRNPARVRWL